MAAEICTRITPRSEDSKSNSRTIFFFVLFGGCDSDPHLPSIPLFIRVCIVTACVLIRYRHDQEAVIQHSIRSRRHCMPVGSLRLFVPTLHSRQMIARKVIGPNVKNGALLCSH